MKTKRDERNRVRAAELREQAAAQASGLQQHEARAKETEAKAAAARAEAERKAAEAERLEAEAKDRASTAEEARRRHEESLRQADELDPDARARADAEAESTTAAPTTEPVATPDGHRADEHTTVVPEQDSGDTARHRA
jgi:hypothetical protein